MELTKKHRALLETMHRNGVNLVYKTDRVWGVEGTDIITNESGIRTMIKAGALGPADTNANGMIQYELTTRARTELGDGDWHQIVNAWFAFK